MRRQRSGGENKEIRSADAGIVGIGSDRRGQPFLPDKDGLQAGRQPVGQDFIDHVEHIVVGMAQARLVIPDRHDRFGIELDLDAALAPLLRLHRHDLGRGARCRNLPERLFDQDNDLFRVDIPHEGNRRVIRTVICLEEGLSRRRSQRQNVRSPSNGRHAIGMRPKGRRGKGFEE